MRDGAVELGFEQREACGADDSHVAKRLRWGARQMPRSAVLVRGDVRRLVEQHEVQREVVELVAAAVQVRGPPLDRLVRDRLARTAPATNRLDRALDQVLVDAAVLVEQPQRRFEPVHERLRAGRASGPRSRRRAAR